MPIKYKSEKLKQGSVQGVAYDDGKGGHLKYASSKNVVPRYGNQARSKAAKNSMRGEY